MGPPFFFFLSSQTLFVPLARVLTGRQNKPRWNRVCKQACEYRHETHKLAPRPDEYASAGIGAGPCLPVIRARSQVGWKKANRQTKTRHVLLQVGLKLCRSVFATKYIWSTDIGDILRSNTFQSQRSSMSLLAQAANQIKQNEGCTTTRWLLYGFNHSRCGCDSQWQMQTEGWYYCFFIRINPLLFLIQHQSNVSLNLIFSQRDRGAHKPRLCKTGPVNATNLVRFRKR